ncbi:hypothetical protein F5Y10DRAFT_248212 [Nemania abortiva]|nr:hypothetical protein F5Y10DRAFT_248212 [Nemania abortiva]
MKRLIAFSWSFPFIHINYDLSQSSTSPHQRTNSNNTSDSSGSARSSKTFRAKRINGNKLRQLLDRNFSSNYILTLQCDNYTVVAERELTDAEIRSCMVLPRRL